MWGAVLGGVASGILGSSGAKDAAKEQSYIAKKQIKFAKKQWNRQNELQKQLYGDQSKDIGAARDAGIGSARDNLDDQQGYAWNLRKNGQADARTAYGQNSALNRNALSATTGLYTDARDQSIGALRGAETRSIQDLKQGGYGAIQGINDARNAGINDVRQGGWGAIRGINDARDAGIGDLRGASADAIRTLRQSRDASVAGFQPAMDMGNNALAAYSSNLGLGKAPKGYAGLGFTPGDEFLMSEGVENIHGSAAGSGTLNSGATLEALERFRSGLAATRRDQSQAELFSLGQLGQNATGNIANIRMGAGGQIASEQSGLGRDIAGLRTGAATQTGNLRYGMGQDVAGLRTSAATQTGSLRYGMGQDVAQVRQGTAGNVANIRTGAAGALAGAQGAYAAAQGGLNDQNYARQTGLDQGYYGALSGTRNDYTNALGGLRQQYVSDMGTARSNRANLSGEANAAYGANALTAMANRGDANAAGAVGSANAWQNALNTGLGIWGYQQGQQQNPATNPYNPANGPLGRAEGMAAGNSNPLSGVTNWLGGLFGRAA